MRLLLVRHGQTDLNVQKRLQGSSEVPLNLRGKEQAKLTHDFLKERDLLPTKVISSPLGRAIETGAIIAGIDLSDYKEREISVDYKPDAIEVDVNLEEMSFGIYERHNMAEENPEFLVECFDRPEIYQPPLNGESYDEVVARAGKVIEKMRGRILAGEYDDDVVMMVSHGALSHGIFEYIKKTPRSAYWDVDFNNCAIVEIFLSYNGEDDDYKYITDGFEKNW